MCKPVVLVALGVFVGNVVAQERERARPGPEAKAQTATQPAVTARTATSPLDFTMQDIDGHDVPLSRYRGQVVLIVNVASKCGLTPQYQDLQALHERYAERGLRVLAFPANNFREQEPGSNAEIKSFCRDNYAVTFDLFGKVSVKGDDACELYKFLTSEEKNPGAAGAIPWNFTKFLVGRDGKVVRRFEPKVKPSDAEIVQAVEQALEAKVTATK